MEKKIIKILLLLIISFSGNSFCGESSVVEVWTRGKNGQKVGTAFLVKREEDRCIFVTNNHVVFNADEIVLVREDKGLKLSARTFKASYIDDIHFISSSECPGLDQVSMASSEPKENDYVKIIGNPGGNGIISSSVKVVLKNGMVGSKVFEAQKINSQPGSSGGPALNSEGKVIGIVSRIVFEDDSRVKTTIIIKAKIIEDVFLR